MADERVQRLDLEVDPAILERTGPGIWTSNVKDFLLEHNRSLEDVVPGGLVGGVRILPQTAFGCAMGWYDPQLNSHSLVYHQVV